ncbi:MAG TPA: zinc metalloprotease HtpX [Candidatus Omnitrophota bacterium]|nr:zinc metalloprotease HtpX [Candidatus Omnitrophota bacterium]
MNTLKTFAFLAALTLLFVWIGGLLGGQNGMTVAFLFACAVNFGSYWFSDKIVLAMYRAQPVSSADAPELYSIVSRLTQKAGLPTPKIYLIPSEAPNAFATGRNPENAAVAVTRGILEILDENELAGVLAHELAHVKHRDILIATVAATVAGAISMLADMARWALLFGGGRSNRGKEGGANPLATLLALFLVPIAAFLIQLAISRSREFAADEGGAQIEGNPEDLASALEKLERYKTRKLPNATPATAHLFIVNPLPGDFFAKLFSTHPPTRERIERLLAMRRK